MSLTSRLNGGIGGGGLGFPPSALESTNTDAADSSGEDNGQPKVVGFAGPSMMLQSRQVNVNGNNSNQY